MKELLDRIDTDRILNQIVQLGQMGLTEAGGVTRLAFSREDFEARRRLIQWMREAGLEVRRDEVGNLIGTRPDWPKDMPIVACGSHIDTVVNAGRYDGIIGMLAAVECARVINENVRGFLQVICFAMEESARFGAGYGFGSRVMAGAPISNDELKSRDRSGVSLAEAVQALKRLETNNRMAADALGQTQRDINSSRADFSQTRAYVELHIEQGPVLDRAGEKIGIVTAIAAPTRMRATFVGEQNHSGTTPMNLRHDALAAAADAILTVERIGQEYSGQGLVATVGMIRAEPNTVNVIPGRAEIAVDLRSIDSKVKRACVSLVTQAMQELGKRRGVQVEFLTLTDEEPTNFSPHVIETIARVCDEMGIDARRMHSGAGHDAAHLARRTNAGMIFIPSVGGVSHDPREFSTSGDITLGVRVLLATMMQLMSFNQGGEIVDQTS